MRKLFLFLSLLFAFQTADAQMQLANPITAKLYANKQVKKKYKRNKARYEAYIPFDLNGGLICLNVNINGQYDNFVLDTGAPTVLLNQYVDPDSANITGRDVSSSLFLKSVQIPSLQLGNIKAQSIEAYELDLSHIEKAKSFELGGLIGYEMFKDYELLLDYKKKRLMFLDTKKSIMPEDLELIGYIPFRMMQHFIVVKAKIGGKKLKLAIDTGAEINILSKKAYDKLKPELASYLDSIGVMGIKNDDTSNSEMVSIPATVIKKRKYKNLSFAVMDLSSVNSPYDINLDGILGFPFLAAQTYSINYTDQKIYIWKTKEIEFKPAHKKQDALVVDELLKTAQ